MIDQVRVVVVTPAGRKRYLKLLIPQILGLRPYVDEYRLWANTTHPEDLEYMKEIEAQYPDFIKIDRLTVPHDHSASICSFFKNCVDNNTVYVRFDDDIVLIDESKAFVEFVKFRIDHPEYFLIYGNIMNNAVLTHIHQRHGSLNLQGGISGYLCMDDIGWRNPLFAEQVHRQVLSKSLDDFRMNNWILYHYERVSINCISWLGSEFAEFNGIVGRDEEHWLSIDKPKSLQKMNCIFGGFVCVHYAFHTQRDWLDRTDILESYEKRVPSLQ